MAIFFQKTVRKGKKDIQVSIDIPTKVERNEIENNRPRKDKAQLDADFHMALVLNDSGRSKEAFELMKRTADAGHTRAQFNTGVFYAQGHGVEQDYGMAVIYYSMAAMLGDRDANYNLGLLFFLGQGIKQPDQEKAFSYFMTAAQLGDYLGMAAVLLQHREGCRKRRRRSNKVGTASLGYTRSECLLHSKSIIGLGQPRPVKHHIF